MNQRINCKTTSKLTLYQRNSTIYTKNKNKKTNAVSVEKKKDEMGNDIRRECTKLNQKKYRMSDSIQLRNKIPMKKAIVMDNILIYAYMGNIFCQVRLIIYYHYYF